MRRGCWQACQWDCCFDFQKRLQPGQVTSKRYFDATNSRKRGLYISVFWGVSVSRWQIGLYMKLYIIHGMISRALLHWRVDCDGCQNPPLIVSNVSLVKYIQMKHAGTHFSGCTFERSLFSHSRHINSSIFSNEISASYCNQLGFLNFGLRTQNVRVCSKNSYIRMSDPQCK